MSRDPVAYPDPGEFKPERFLKDGVLDPNVRDPLKYQLGFGRRCVPYSHVKLLTTDGKPRQDLSRAVLRKRCALHHGLLGASHL